jgi:ActR/RegA family two-component response regulator
MPKCHVLLVDDDPRVLRSVARVLEFLGHDVERAESVRASLACLATMQFDMVVTDLSLRDGSGLEVIEAAGGADARIVALCDDSDDVLVPDHVARAPRMGNLGDLIAAVRGC